MLKIAGIDRLDLTNNPGSDRPAITIWFQGCTFGCGGCQNPKLQDSSGGREYTITDVVSIINMQRVHCESYDIVLLGGEPLQQDHHELKILCKTLRDMGHRIWLYTGYDIDDIPHSLRLELYWVKTGRYIEGLKTGKFPASSNQHIYLNNGYKFTLIS